MGHRIVDVPHHIEVSEANRPLRHHHLAGWATQEQSRRNRPTISGLGKDLLERQRWWHRAQRLGVEMHPEGGRAQRTSFGPVDVNAPFRPARTDTRAPRDQVERFEVRRKPQHVNHGSAHYPGHLCQPGVAGVVVGDVLQISRRRIEAQPPTWRAITESNASHAAEQAPGTRWSGHLEHQPTINELTQPRRSGCLSLDSAHLCPVDEPRKVPGTDEHDVRTTTGPGGR